MYSAAVAPLFSHLSKRKKWLFGYLLTDHSFALMMARFGPNKRGDGVPHLDAYYFGSAGAMWLMWQVTVAIGIFAGTLVPSKWSLDFAIPLVFLSLVIPALTTRAHWGAAICAGVAAAFTTALPLKLGLISAALVGVMVGVLLDRVGRTAVDTGA
jgi:predicted branched-subunit amino acid permease